MRRQTLWFDFAFQENSLAASATAVLTQSLNAAALALRPFTVTRTLMTWHCTSDQSGATETYIGNIAFAVVTDQAVAIGVTAVPTPATDLGSDVFFLHGSWIGFFQLVGTSIMSEVTSKLIESRAQRKVVDGQDIVLVKEAGLGGQGVTVRSVGRMLVKLH